MTIRLPITGTDLSGRPNISKTVGHEPRTIPWPSPVEVEDAIDREDGVQLLTWTRFLPSPETGWHRDILARIHETYPNIRRKLEGDA